MAAFRKRKGGRPFSRQALELWLGSPRGRHLLEREAVELCRVLPEVFGRHVLQVGSWGRDGQLLRASETLHSAVIGTVPGMGEQAVADPECLPVLTRSVERNGILKASDIAIERRPKAEAGNDAALRNRAIGM